MGPEMDALQNFQGIGGMGPGAIAMGITRDINVDAEDKVANEEEGEEGGGD